MTEDLLDPRDLALAVLDLNALRALEQRAAAQYPPHTLMARAGETAARFLGARLVRTRGRRPPAVFIAAGPGNNGGDALVTATALLAARVRVLVCLPQAALPDDARWALAQAREAGVPIVESFDDAAREALASADWAVDGMFGAGLARPLDGVFATLAAALSARTASGGPVLALDLPSGLASDNGLVISGAHGGAASKQSSARDTAVRATDTLAFLALKPGLYTGVGRDLSGRLWLAPLGVDDGSPSDAPAAVAARAHCVVNAPALFMPSIPRRDFAANKGTFGSLAVVGGDTGMCGAPILASRAALFAGAGKVHVALLGAGGPAYDPPHPELMLHEIDHLPLDEMSALAIGPGFGRSDRVVQRLDQILRLQVPKVVDADALNLLSTHPALADALRAGGAATVITPHPLEAARLLDTDVKSIEGDRLAAVRSLSERFGCVAVLKGSGTLIAAPSQALAINPTGDAGLATGGTGDVLCGLIGAFLAQHVGAREAALAAVFLHGRAAETLGDAGHGPAGLTASELAPAVRSLLNQLLRSHAVTRAN
ncbi:MAG: NAD(P)H-hydrate dehydratase [Janthinobacterium lividum]